MADEKWSLHPTARLEGRYDDNVNLSAASSRYEASLRFSTALGLVRAERDNKVSAIVGLDFINYSRSDSPPETTNQFIRFSGERIAPRNKWQLDAAFQRDSLLRTAEVPTFDPVVIDPGSGSDINISLVTVAIERRRYSVSPAWNYDLTRTDRLKIGYGLTAERFEQTAGIDLVDYDRHVLSAGLTHRLSMNNSISANVRANRFEPKGRDSVDTYELIGGFAHNYSPVDSVELELGARRVVMAADTTGFVAGVTWLGRTELSFTSLRVERQIYPNGYGDLTETDQVIAQWKRRLTHTTEFLSRVRAFNADPLSPGSTNGRKYAQFDAELHRAVGRWWDLGFAYRHRWIDRESDPQSAASNAVFISIGYDKPEPIE